MAADRRKEAQGETKNRMQDVPGASLMQTMDPAALGATMAGIFVPVTTVNRSGIAEDLDDENFREME